MCNCKNFPTTPELEVTPRCSTPVMVTEIIFATRYERATITSSVASDLYRLLTRIPRVEMMCGRAVVMSGALTSATSRLTCWKRTGQVG
jgi:hypothetical protein